MGIKVADIRAVCHAGKENQPRWYRVHREVSIYITWALLHTSITANQVSGLMILMGALGAVLFAFEPVFWSVIGLIVLYVSFVLDKVDGEIARYRMQESALGLFLDWLYHRVTLTLFYGALAYRTSLTMGPSAFVVGAIAALFANLIEEGQLFHRYIFARRILEGFEALRRPPLVVPATWRKIDRLARILKVFRTNVLVFPLFFCATVLEAYSNSYPFSEYMLMVGAGSLAVYFVIQTWFQVAWRLYADLFQMVVQFDHRYRETDSPECNANGSR